MKKVTRMIAFIVISFIVLGLYSILTLFLLSKIIESNFNIYLKLIFLALSSFLLTKAIYQIIILGTFTNAIPKNLMYPKYYLPFVLIFSIVLIIYTVVNYSYLFDYEYAFISIQTLLFGFFVISIYYLISPLIYFYTNTIKPIIKLSNVEIRYSIYKQYELLYKRENVAHNVPYWDNIYWKDEFMSENKSFDDYKY